MKNLFQPQSNDGVPEIQAEQLFSKFKNLKDQKVALIDVRRSEEFNGELGHIEGSSLITLGPELSAYLQQGNREQKIIFICRSGVRSGNSTLEAKSLGYNEVLNLAGGMIRWNQSQFPVVRKD